MKIEEIRYMIGKEYCDGLHAENEETQEVKEAFDTIKKVNAFLFEQIPFEVVFTEKDTYSTAKEMRERVMSENRIYIYSGWSGHPFLTQDENNIGRAVHDVYAHLVCGCPFNFQGEYNGFLEQAKYYPESVFPVLFAEIPAQTSAYYYKGSFNYSQRAMMAPQTWIDATSDMKKDYSHNSVLAPFNHYYAEVV